jgi:hypothetical protein
LRRRGRCWLTIVIPETPKVNVIPEALKVNVIPEALKVNVIPEARIALSGTHRPRRIVGPGLRFAEPG